MEFHFLPFKPAFRAKLLTNPDLVKTVLAMFAWCWSRLRRSEIV